MGILKSIIHLGGGQGYTVPPAHSVVYQSPWSDEVTTTAGREVTPTTAMSYVPFFAGVRLIAESVGRMPQILYRKRGSDDRERAEDVGLYNVLRHEPNAAMSAMTWKSTSIGHIVTRGNCYSEQVFDGLGRLSELWPIRPDRVAVMRDSDTGEKFYRIRIETLGDIVDLRPDKVFHVPGFGYDGLVGYSIVTLFRQAIAVGLSAEEFAARFFKNGARPAAVVKHPADWDDDRIKKFAARLRGNHSGLSNAQRIALIEEGITWDQVGMNLDDAQFLETQGFSRSLAATMLNIPPHMLQDTERSTSWGTGIEEQTLGFVTFSLGSWTDLFDAETNRQLVRPAYPDMYAEHLIDALLKGRALDRWRVYEYARKLGVMNAEDIARRENLPVPPDDRGKAYWKPVANFELDEEPEDEDELRDTEPEPATRNGRRNGATTLRDGMFARR